MSQLYDKAREQFAGTELVWLTNTFRAQLLSDGYVFNAQHQYLSDLSAGFLLAASEPLLNKSRTDGYCRADPVNFPALVTASPVAQYLVYKDTGDPATSLLVCWSKSVQGFPFQPTGLDYTLLWGSGSNVVFRL